MLFYRKRRWAACWTVLTLLACGVTLYSNTVYLEAGATAHFLLEKGDWACTPWWLAAFAFHVAGASVCLAAGAPLLFPSWTQRHPVWHRRLGYLYFNAVLWMAAPTGIALSVAAKGGLWGTAGFAVAGTLWWATTWAGYRAIRRGNLSAHVRAMVRSYAWALSAPAFRAIQAALFLAGLEDNLNYILSLWLSIAASVWLAESFLTRGRAGVPFATTRSPQAGMITWTAR